MGLALDDPGREEPGERSHARGKAVLFSDYGFVVPDQPARNPAQGSEQQGIPSHAAIDRPVAAANSTKARVVSSFPLYTSGWMRPPASTEACGGGSQACGDLVVLATDVRNARRG
jgi:hypothetical protein